MKKSVWISYDLGVRGDYSGLFEWLDNHNAKECGDSVAFIKYEVKNDGELIETIKNDISENVELKKRDRIYIVYRNEEKEVKGKYICGRRKASPWEGYAEKEEEIDE